VVRGYLFAALAAVAGCSAIVGNEDIVLLPPPEPAPSDGGADAAPPLAPDAQPTIDVASTPDACANPPCVEDLITGMLYPTEVAADATTVYVTETRTGATPGVVWSCPAKGCSSATAMRIAPNEDAPQRVALDATNVYWINGKDPYGIHSCSRTAGCAASTLLVDTFPAYLVVAPEGLYFAGGANLFSAPKAAPSTRADVTQLPNPQASVINGLAYFNGDLAWVAYDYDPASPNANPRIQACTAASCTASLHTIAPAVDIGVAIALDASGVYWLEGVDKTGSLYRCPEQACAAPTQLASGIEWPSHIVIDDNNVYFSAYTGPDITETGLFVCAKTGCAAPTLIGRSQGMPGGVATDGSFLYFVTSPRDGTAKGALHRVPKPQAH
jgi:hypothetical protein